MLISIAMTVGCREPVSLKLADVSFPVLMNDRTLDTGSPNSVGFTPVQPFESKCHYNYEISGQGISIGPHAKYSGDILEAVVDARKKDRIDGILLKEIRTYGAISHTVVSYFITSRISIKGETVKANVRKKPDAPKENPQ
jgi:hypothetical protein